MSVNLRFARPFGPFTEMANIDLPKFSILTGKNGSGKTQLLKGIESGNVEIAIGGNKIQTSSILYIGNSLKADINVKISIKEVIKKENDFIAYHQNLVTSNFQFGSISNDSQVSAELKHVLELAQILQIKPQEIRREELEYYAFALNQSDEVSLIHTDFDYNRYTQDSRYTKSLKLDLAMISMGFLRRFYWWNRTKSYASVGGERINRLLEKIGDQSKTIPPWELISQSLKDSNFCIIGPPLNFESAQQDLSLKLQNSSGRSVAPEHLSSGEKAIVALCLAQYAASINTQQFPNLMMLDESFCALHPTFVRRALDIVQDVFVRQHQMSVILVTHNPSIVAQVPHDSLFEVTSTETKLVVNSISVDRAIGLLCTAVPSMRFDPKNRRQVLVEAQQDELVFSNSYQALLAKDYLDPSISLEFLCWSRQEGTCSKVLDLVPRLRESGVASAFGVVDWDTTNKTDIKSGIFVVGENERYAIETIFLDPLLILFLLSQTENGRKSIDLPIPTPIIESPPEKLQELANAILAKIFDQLPKGKPVESEVLVVEYVGAMQLSLPKWCLQMNGHEYATAVLKAFPFLRKYQTQVSTNRDEDKLIGSIAKDFLPNCTRFIPKCLLDIFKQIQAQSPQVA